MRYVKRLLFPVYVLLAAAVLLEIAVRLWGYSDHYIYDPIYRPCEQSADIPYVHRPNLHNARARGSAVINTDSLGLRALESGATYGRKKDDEFRIAITGDSVTFGEGVADTGNVYPMVLAKILNRKKGGPRVTVFNYAVSAYSVRQMAATLRSRMLAIEPDLVIMAIIPADFDLSRTGTVDRWGYTAHSDGSSGLFGNDSLAKRLLRRVHLTYVLRDILHRSRAGGTGEAGTGAALSASYRYVTDFVRFAADRRLPSLVLLLPSLHQAFSPAFLARLRRDQVPFLDLGSVVSEFPVDRFMASRFDAHPSAVVHARIAALLADYLLKSGLVPGETGNGTGGK
ncbi:MAG TPA: SGNH/GDSL hydrolase family protein [Desulfobulbus sp.]|nr:SGNH/GDSL hydrolase family protein [Desulfobulbus sp.]